MSLKITVVGDMNLEIYAVFRMNIWRRDMSPTEIFHDLIEAKRFMSSYPDTDWAIYRRTSTDWEKMIGV